MNKRLAVLLIGLVLIAVFVVLNAVVFTVKEVTVDFDTESGVDVEEGTDKLIVEASGVKTGKNIFAISESKMVKNVQSRFPGIRVTSIERRFPNKVIIHVSQRKPVYVLEYTTGTSTSDYVLVDGDMTVLALADGGSGCIRVEGFALQGRYNITVGKVLPVEFGDNVFILQNIAAGFYNEGLTPAGFTTFIESVRFADGFVYLLTNSGVIIGLGNNLKSADVAERIPKAYKWYTDIQSADEDSEALTKGMVLYVDGNFVWNDYQ